MTTMDLRLLEIFCRVYKKRSFSGAARELHLTQPTVSAHIKELEESLGAAVFSRLGREIQPTEAGRLLYEHAKPIVGLKRNVIETMAGFLNRIEGVLTVGASSVPGECLLPRLITEFRALHPAVRGRLRISDTASTLEDVRHGDIELGAVGATVPEDDLVFEPLAEDALVLVVPGTPEWKNRRQVSMRQLRELPLIVRETGSGTRAVLERALARRKTDLSELNIVAELGSLGATKTAVRDGYGVSFISERAVASERDAGLVRIARVTELGRIPRTYYSVISRRRALSPLTRAFVEHLRGSAAARRPTPRASRR
jgi:DNA-binding transcriptional LysR family regulator